jgi:glutamine synthetase
MKTTLPIAGSFVERHDLWSDAQLIAAKDILQTASTHKLEVVRFVFADQHGLTRGKGIMADAVPSMLVSGCTMTSTLILKDTSHRTVMPVWQTGAGLDNPRLAGAADLIMIPDPTTFRILPWAPGTGWILCDLYYPDGEPVAYATRQRLRDALEKLHGMGLELMSGLELEFHLFRREQQYLTPADCSQPGSAPAVTPLQRGHQYLTELRYDEMEPVFGEIRRGLQALKLPLRSEEIEFGPSQLEVTFSPERGMASADNAILARNAIKQIAQRLGYHATFMCRPQVANTFASGWHLHQSLVDLETGANLFMPEPGGAALSILGQHYVAGLLEHAAASCLLTSPTINAYKRYRPNALAPDRIQWGRDNKGAMLRVLGGPGDPATRVENRVGEPAANPYLYVTSQLLSGIDGITRALPLPPPVEEPYSSSAERLPRNIIQALGAFETSGFYREALGDNFVNYFAAIKQAEIDRFFSEVTDWEQREYFEMF